MCCARDTPYQFGVLLSAAELSARGRLLGSARAAGIRAIPLGDSVLLWPESQARERGVLVPLYARRVGALCHYLGRHVHTAPTSWHTLPLEVLATAPEVPGPLVSPSSAPTTSH